jgi:hypothetical protein
MASDNLKVIAYELNSMMTHINARIQRVQAELALSEIGIHSEVNIDKNHTLVFTKKENRWQICIVNHTTKDIKPLLDSSREERIEALYYLNDLREEIIARATSLIAYARRVL